MAAKRGKGRSLELFFIDGKPDGMLTAEVFNWTGHVLMAPRTQIVDALLRREASHTGVYLLLGEVDGEPLLYVGEGENISDRIRNHDARKDWWTTAILITSAANSLNKAHVKYLESRLLEEARSIAKIALENGTAPALPTLSESARDNMEAFLEYVFMVLPALRIDCFLRNTRPEHSTRMGSETKFETPVFELRTVRHGLHAIAKLDDGEFIVQAGSNARKEWSGKGSENTAYGQLYVELVRTGVLQQQNSHRIFSANYAFKSPSAAGAVVNGRPTNGTLEWKLAGTDKTYKQWEAEKLT